MKKIYVAMVPVFVLAVAINACKNYRSTEPKQSRMDSLINSSGGSVDSAYMQGAKLIAANDCITCHNIDKKMFGPSFIQIATKYNHDEKFADYLANNVIKGSRGLYGNNAMTPHPNLNRNDLDAMIRYILSLKTQQ